MNELDLHSFKKEVIADSKVMFALENGLWMEVTSIAKENGKDLSNYWRSKDTTEYMEVISELNSVNITELKTTVQGKHGGTYIHPELVVHFARWISPKFAVACDRFVKSEFEKTAKIREETLIEYHKEELQKVLREAKKLNDYDGFISIKKFVNEIDNKAHTQSFVWDALEYMGWMKNIRIEITERRLDDSCPAFVGGRIPKTQTPIYTEAAIREAIKQYVESIKA